MDFHFADDLVDAIAEKGSPVCVGLDPVYDKLPSDLAQADEDAQQAPCIQEFCKTVLQIVAPIVPAVKIQSACFERYGSAGVRAYEQLIDDAHDLDLLVIGDIKRNDIGSTAQAYATGHLRGLATADAVTVNGYLGSDGISPFIEAAEDEAKGVFVLVRTSNPSARQLQDIADASGKKLFEHMADLVSQLGCAEGLVGSSGYSCVGAVVGATYPDEARRLRQLMPQQIFLVPGYGAQGATARDCMAAFKSDGRGAIVNASRSVIFAHADKKYAGVDWKTAILQAAKEFAADIRAALRT